MAGTYKVVFMVIDPDQMQKQFAEIDWPVSAALPPSGAQITVLQAGAEPRAYVVADIWLQLALPGSAPAAPQTQAGTPIVSGSFGCQILLMPTTQNDPEDLGPNVVPFVARYAADSRRTRGEG